MSKIVKAFIIILVGCSILKGQSDSNIDNTPIIQVLHDFATDNGIKVYYSLENLADVDINKIESLTHLEEILNHHNYQLLQYTERQYIIVNTDYFNLNQEEWESQQELKLLSQEAQEDDILIIGEINEKLAAETFIVDGILKEANSSEPIIGATVSSGSLGAVTDGDGYYSLSLPSGIHTIIASSIGLQTSSEKVLVQGNGRHDIVLFNATKLLEEIVISGESDNTNVSSIEMGLSKLSIKEIQKLPSFMGELDVIKSLLSLPGVSTAGEGVGGINVRGGNVDQNLIIQDGILFFNPSHSLGFFNLFHPDLVKDIKLYKGNIPAKYGGRISSVLSTSSKDGSKTKWSGKAGLGLTSSKISIDGPIMQNKLSMTLGGRVSTINWLLNSINVPDVKNSKVNFYDLQGKLNYWIDNQSNIGMQFYNSNDDFTLADELQFDYQTKAISLFYNRVIGDNKSLSARIVSSEYNSNLNDLLPSNSTQFSTGVNYISSRIDMTLEQQKSIINIGLEGIYYTVKPGSVFPGSSGSDVQTKLVDNELGTELGLYASMEWQPVERMKILGGLRLSGFALLGPKEIRNYNTSFYFNQNDVVSTEIVEDGIIDFYYGIEPRLALNFGLNESASLKLGYNRTYQYLSQISNTVAATPVDFWKVSDNNIKPQSAHSLSFGVYKNFKDNLWKTSIEVYYRSIDNALAYRDFADLIANENIETELLIGEGKNYGAELSIEKTLGRLTSRLGYSYTRSLLKMEFDNPEITINRGKWYPANFDKPHNLNLLLNLNLSKRVNFNFNFVYSTGRSISAPRGKYDDFNVFGIPVYDQVNNFRVPDFHRLDFSINIFPGYRKDRKVKGSWNFSLYNLYGRKNAYSVYFKQQSLNNLEARKLAILGTTLPSVSYQLIFN